MKLPFLRTSNKPAINLPDDYPNWPESAQKHYMEAQAVAVKSVAEANARVAMVKSRHRNIMHGVVGVALAVSGAFALVESFKSNNDQVPPSSYNEPQRLPPSQNRGTTIPETTSPGPIPN